MQASLEQSTHALSSDASTRPSQPSQHVPSHDFSSSEEDEEQRIMPPVVPPETPTTGNVPTVQGTPQVGTVPSVPGGAGTVASTLTAGTLAKVVVILATCAAVIFAGVKVIPPILYHSTATPTTSITPVTKTLPMPPTQTSCPAQGTARAAVTAPLVLGTHQNLVYLDNAVYGNITGTLKRYDVTTGQKTTIVQLANGHIGDAQISADGQWVLFTSSVNRQAALQMVRMDGQGLQTLYCVPTDPNAFRFPSEALSSLAWSSDQTLAMFIQQAALDSQASPVYLLNLATGKVQQELELDPNSGESYSPYVWIDNTHIALLDPQGIYVLSTNNGSHQQSSNLQLLVKASGSCFDSVISSDHTNFFLSQCTTDSSSNQQGSPSSISVVLVTGGAEHTIFTSQVLTVTSINVTSKTTLLITIHNAHDSDTSQNGLYTMRIDGTGLTKVVGADVISHSLPQGFNLDQSSFPRPVVSRDGSKYALYFHFGCGMACWTDTLLFGSVSGGAPTTIASLGSGDALAIVGWTTM